MIHPMLISGLIIITVLAAIAAYYHLKLWKKQRDNQKKLNALEQESQQKLAKLKNDILFILKAYADDQVELPEASLRISKLADVVDMPLSEREDYAIFDKIAAEIHDIPTHEEWKALDKNNKKRFERKFNEINQEYTVAAKEAAKSIIMAANPTLH